MDKVYQNITNDDFDRLLHLYFTRTHRFIDISYIGLNSRARRFAYHKGIQNVGELVQLVRQYKTLEEMSTKFDGVGISTCKHIVYVLLKVYDDMKRK